MTLFHIYFMACNVFNSVSARSAADPGFPVGGVDLVRGEGALTPEAVTFRKFCMSK